VRIGKRTLTLAHGKARFNEDFSALLRHGYATSVELDAPEHRGGQTAKVTGRDVAAHRWLTGRKKAMLSSSVVGTIDQLLFAALKSRHLALRHLGLAGKIVIIDEAHAYDVYMSHYLDRALEWLLRSLAVLHPYLDGGRTLRLPADIAPIVQAAYSDTPIGPAPWQEAMAAAKQRHDTDQQQKEHKAGTFRLAPAGPAGQPIVGWLDAGVGDVDDDPRLEGRRQVRDTAAESVEVIVLVRHADGRLVTPPWLRRDGGRQVPADHEPERDLARTIATCTLTLPIELCRIETIEQLEQQNHFPAWQRSPWLAGELVGDHVIPPAERVPIT
jgi:hypothetical protein